jgi:protein-S-isoprenylcysteine O-methyltransferase Ste14
MKKTAFHKRVYSILTLLISMSGYVPKNATILRTFAFLASISIALYLGKYQSDNSQLAIIYFIIVEVFYLGFITIVLSENGLRRWFIRRWGDENEGYLAYEAILGLLFFHNGISIGYIASSSPGNLLQFIPGNFLLIIVAIMFINGFIVKTWAAQVVEIEIYYWKDMFLGKKICDFVVSGPYKYLNNPMYGIGQLQAYAIAIWYGSMYGLIAAFINQLLIFSFFYLVEKKFIKRVYQSNQTM